MNDLSPKTLVADYRSGKQNPRVVLEQVYARIRAAGERPVYISLMPFEDALVALERAAKSQANLALFGVPFAVKDNIDVAGLPTTAACPEFSYVPEKNAAVVERLVQAGAIVIGKTNLDQFATGLVGTRSPYGACASVFDARYISGGSSSGSAVAVARGDVSFALGTDTAGSGRVPAAFNALVGLKPTRGLLSTRGVVPACRSLDCVSIFAKNLGDAESVLDVAAGYDVLDPFSRRAPGSPPLLGARPRVGVPRAQSLKFFGDQESALAFQSAVARLRALPADLVEVDLTPFYQAAALLYEGPWVAERLAAIGTFAERNPNAIHPVVKGIIESARGFSARAAFEASYRLAELRRTSEAVFSAMDALVVPTAPTHYSIEQVLAEPVALNQNLGTYTNFVNLLDLAALAVPSGFKDGGLPFGVTLIAPAFHDARLLELAGRFCGEPTQPITQNRDAVLLAVAGAHLSGQALNAELVTRGARLIETTTTAASYRMFALATEPPKPGLVYSPNAGHAIEVEVWALDRQAFGDFVASVPPPMAIGSTRLADGTLVKGFLCEPYAIEGARDISEYGGFRAFLAAARR